MKELVFLYYYLLLYLYTKVDSNKAFVSTELFLDWYLFPMIDSYHPIGNELLCKAVKSRSL